MPRRICEPSRRQILKAGGSMAASALLASGVPAMPQAKAAGGLDGSIGWARANVPNSTPAIIGAAAKEGKLVLTLLLHGDDDANSAMVRKFRERYPFLDVAYTLQTITQLLGKFNAEINSGKGVSDYFHLPTNLKEADEYVVSGSIARFVVSQDAAFPDATKHSGFWYPWSRNAAVTAYRMGALSDEEKTLIRTYEGLADPRFKGRLGIGEVSNSLTASGSYILMKQPGQAVWAGLAANKPRVKSGTSPLTDGVLAGEYDVAVFDSLAMAEQAAMQNAPIEFVISSPSALVCEPGGISALAPHPNAAMLWQDWMMSKEGQDLWSSVTGAISARSDVDKPWSLRQPWFFEDAASQQAIDWAQFSKDRAEIVARFRRDIQGS